MEVPIPLLLHKTLHPVLIHRFPEFQKQYIMISNLSQPLIAMDYTFPGLICIWAVVLLCGKFK